ncbi:hypothetical protein PVAND_013053 [Polypedilum vanderplanki]|uniref:Transmembrane protein n=1 Tax=Polypedilum vanderplanki TaxID=319348 RepID=A0A9J6CP82_POLVA|nr:hypothetical protein PVAND_013053 [Polypedilum vanderplanki]
MKSLIIFVLVLMIKSRVECLDSNVQTSQLLKMLSNGKRNQIIVYPYQPPYQYNPYAYQQYGNYENYGNYPIYFSFIKQVVKMKKVLIILTLITLIQCANMMRRDKNLKLLDQTELVKNLNFAAQRFSNQQNRLIHSDSKQTQHTSNDNGTMENTNKNEDITIKPASNHLWDMMKSRMQ